MEIFLVGLLVVVGIFFLGYSIDKKNWNKGWCQRHNHRWIHFDNDSQGGRGYKCRNKGKRPCYTWISWPVDKRARMLGS